MSPDYPEGLFQKFPERQILVIGDLLLDEYLWGHVQRISPEAPVPILNIVRRHYTLGGAGNVVKNLRSLGARVTVLAAAGEDACGSQIAELLSELGAVLKVVSDPGRKSSRKTRLMSLEHGQQVFRFDEESSHPITERSEDALLSHLEVEVPTCHAILCSDYMKGVLTERVLQRAIGHAKARAIPIVVAPKDSHAEKYKGASVLVPNVKELMQLAGTISQGTQSFTSAAAELMGRLDVSTIVVTRGSEGISLFERTSGIVRHAHIPTVAKTVYDVTGAGDTFVSMFTVAVAAGASHEDAARLANTAAGIVVGKRGTASVTVDEMKSAVEDQDLISVPLAYEAH